MPRKNSPQDSEIPGKKNKGKKKKGKKEQVEEEQNEQGKEPERRDDKFFDVDDRIGRDVKDYLKRGFEKSKVVMQDVVMPSLKRGFKKSKAVTQDVVMPSLKREFDYSKKRFQESKVFRYGVIGAGVLAGVLVLGKMFGGSRNELSFVAENDIYVVRDDGSGKRNITNTPHIKKYGPSWSHDGSQVAFNAGSLPMSTIHIITRHRKKVKELTPSGGSNVYLVFSPDSRRLAFVNYPSNQIFTIGVDGSDLKKVGSICRDSSVKWVDNYRVAFRALAGELSGGVSTGTRVCVANADGSGEKILSKLNIESLSKFGIDRPVRSYSLSADGERIIMQVDDKIHAGSLDGKIELLEGLEIGGDFPALSPNGTEIVYSRNGCIYTTSFRGSKPRKLTDGPEDSGPIFSPDGEEIAFKRGRDIWVMYRNGSRERNVTNTPEVEEEYVSWLPE